MEVNKFRIALAGYFLIVIMISAIDSNRHRDPGTPSGVGFIHAVCDFRALKPTLASLYNLNLFPLCHYSLYQNKWPRQQPKKTRKPPGRRIQIRGYICHQSLIT